MQVLCLDVGEDADVHARDMDVHALPWDVCERQGAGVFPE
jgi:hypothetical protein